MRIFTSKSGVIGVGMTTLFKVPEVNGQTNIIINEMVILYTW